VMITMVSPIWVYGMSVGLKGYVWIMDKLGHD
jgi:hypothetical protein